MLAKNKRKRILIDDVPSQKQPKNHSIFAWNFSEEKKNQFEAIDNEDIDIGSEEESDSDDETDDESTTIIMNGPYGEPHELQKEYNKAKDLRGEVFFISTIGYESGIKPKIKAELEVCGGNLYALLMGESQPNYFVGQDNNEAYYRLSSPVNFAAEGEDIFKFHQPINRFIFSLVISYFLGDNDISNIGVVKRDQQLLVVRIDPECCFSDFFLHPFHNQLEQVLAELNFLNQLNIDNTANKDVLGQFLEKEKNVEFFRSCFNHKLLINKASLELLSSSAKNIELEDALNTIIKTPIGDYEEIIDRTISDLNKRDEIKKALINRVKIFTEAWNSMLKKREEHLGESNHSHRLFSANQKTNSRISFDEPYLTRGPLS